ncbi:MAG TPA: hypothetical protein VF843_09715 [Streptosporangiaceae bacterium]
MSTYGTHTPWSPAPDETSTEQASTDETSTDQTSTDEASTGPEADPADGSFTGAAAQDVIVVESVHSPDQDESTADGASAAAPAAGTTPAGGVSPAGLPGGNGNSAAEWSEIKALFVDDPGASVRRASDLVERAVDGFMTSLRQRQQTIGSSWQEGDAAGTEELRKALRGYRGLFDQLEELSGQFPAGSSAAGAPAASGTASSAASGI